MTINERIFSDVERKVIILRAVMYWDQDGLLDQIIEECSEVITAIQHLKREKSNLEEVLNEVADVSIMIDHLKEVTNETLNFDLIKDRKLLKMRNLMNEGKK